MAMAVAENAITVPAQRVPTRQINVGLASLAGGVLLLVGLWLVFGGLPVFWHDVLPTVLPWFRGMNEFLSAALLLIVGIVALSGICYAWYQLDRRYSTPGLRAGSIVEAVLIFTIAAIAFAI